MNQYANTGFPTFQWKAAFITGMILTAFFLIVFGIMAKLASSLLLTFLVYGALLLINIAKQKILREPLVLQDFFLVGQVFRHPDLYIGYVGYLKVFAVAALLSAGIGVPFIFENPYSLSFSGRAVLILTGCLIAVTVLLFFFWNEKTEKFQSPKIDAMQNVVNYGLLGSFCFIAAKLMTDKFYEKRYSASPTVFKNQDQKRNSPAEHPHIILIQAESFIAPSRFLKNEEYCQFCMPTWHKLSQQFSCGLFRVPAWGANTMRTEFSVLTGKSNAEMGPHKYNPFLTMPEESCKIWSIPGHLKKEYGYETLAVHPFKKEFFGRDKTFPLLGFDEFVDESAFVGAEKRGHYISDKAVADYTADRLTMAQNPQFIFIITMEAHGPWNDNRLMPEMTNDPVYSHFSFLPESIRHYVYNLNGLDRMIERLIDTSGALDRPVVLGIYGDHPPMLPIFTENEGIEDDTNFLIYASHNTLSPEKRVQQFVESHEFGLLVSGFSGHI